MRLLTATTRTQGTRPWDFAWCIEGELLLPVERCDRDEALDVDPAEDCGCGRSLTGLHTGRCTTTAAVEDLPLSLDDVALAVAAFLSRGVRAAGDVVDQAHELDDPQDHEDAHALAEAIATAAAAFPAGTVVGRWRERLVPR